ncbi:Dipeptide and tripeptide permease A [Candidatus Westeberhardia cardiocondylae]|uniref:Dipeptide and tripeptide permease A n=1 Tax=Candidatus Westeberhardia cardiocondylae TaxID=1594731 RepID=A0A0H5BX08_9ENTR|nr:Dipeptide and tripeptide permease A [Candidatus Westeberhardia cardiocondylae]
MTIKQKKNYKKLVQKNIKFKKNTFKQPKLFYLIFSIEIWERFGYYGLQSIFVIYLVKILGLSESSSITLFSSFNALVCGFVSIGGWLGDKILGTKRVIILGTIVLITGYSIIACSEHKIYSVYLGMATIAIGSGLFKANPSALLSTCYNKEDPKLDSAFTMYYMAINIGSFISMLFTPWIAIRYGWNIAFSLSVIGMIITLLNFISFYNIMKKYGSKPDFIKLKLNTLLAVISGIILLIPLSCWLLYHQNIARIFLILITIIIFTILIYETIKLYGISRKRMLAALIMMLEAIVFFVLYNQTPTSLNFFAIHNVETKLFGIYFEPEQYQALNPLWIIIMSPILAKFYNKTGNRFPIPFKFAVGMAFCSMSFLILSLGIKLTNDSNIVSIYWLILSYALQSIGELMISGLGMSMIAKLVPRRLTGFVMGAWFLTTATSAIIAGFVANLSVIPNNLNDPKISLILYSQVFMKIGIYSGIISIFMLLFARKVIQLLKTKKLNNQYTK